MLLRFKKCHCFGILKKNKIALLNMRGAISVEYAFSMIIAALIMLGVLEIFTRMSLDVFNKFLKLLQTYP